MFVILSNTSFLRVDVVFIVCFKPNAMAKAFMDHLAGEENPDEFRKTYEMMLGLFGTVVLILKVVVRTRLKR